MTLRETLDESDMSERFDYILARISELKDIPSFYEGADDLELNVKLLQDKIRDRYFRQDAKRERQRRRSARGKRVNEEQDPDY